MNKEINYLKNGRTILDHHDGEALNLIRDTVYRFNIKQGWHKNQQCLKDSFENYYAATLIALIHSELSEALEGLRKNLMDEHLPNRKMVEVELADALIRIMDMAGALNLDIGGAVVDKDYYNHHREDHKEKNRQNSPNGKKF